MGENKKEKMAINNTAEFKNIVESGGDLAQAEKWTKEAYGSKEGYGDKWLEDRQRELLGAYCENGDKEGAQRIIKETMEYNAQKGRIGKYEKYFGEYAGSRLEPVYNKEKTEMPINNSTTFKQALAEGRLEEAEKWLKDPATINKYESMPNVLEDRRKELAQARKNLK
ncbi:hypothetical protein CO115_02000 [Candidatus Falkowbacteria bacterium CG_4_9_14_3_um_filter_36_9]|uniref:Uncharacterized protein n=1 Tax=Candidatus Falkowbacteria bacterium CG02_land_8_20_14_3_00_36_14 TaxID=1974560 RepID=A0A2M7DLC1_9BACT|nr:MAG: hypothetical protein COS18_04640 [Candidatus Falkowbacteria bacterium CG02_land_8_20_14_3_00_36_14]PIX12391.1 MAG: hypothetical protein COZ73_00235 [Candidatus Falkowbacteria bacterium CG_4_8_14_3_um_filter_36_11]PJA10425.1 MAG: hypothetical protein COX67_04660 [Candidatus Falkowbacteria bacterium CG_4_10_14_0_2_um_filter_36_22]PJB19926.1 MAG: hypothetical protein CO115_02000 [Candidatus Falkowbacteria bacterium CG_4_9_14_3_um_filter_36_9]